MDRARFKEMFIAEATDHLQRMGEQLLNLEGDEDGERVAALFREAHSIKGMAATMEYLQTARVAHYLEDLLDHCRQHGRIPEAVSDRLFEGTDLLDALLEDIRNECQERDVTWFIEDYDPVPAEAAEVTADSVADDGPEEEAHKEARQVHLQLHDRVAVPGPRLLVILKNFRQWGQLLSSSPSEDELLAADPRTRLTVTFSSLLSDAEIQEKLQDYSELREVTFPGPETPEKPRVQTPPQYVRVSTDLLDHFINLTGELITNRYRLQGALREADWNEMDEGVGQLSRLVKNLHHQVLKVRMESLDNLTRRLSRMVHDLNRSSGKDVSLKVDVAGIEMDRAIVEVLADPLGHLVRNAVDHGIDQKGTISIKAWRERDQVLLQVADDGRGIDPQAIRERALAAGLVGPEQLQRMREADLLQLICQPGFSTAGEVTERSGRGVGMDVVKTALDQIGGMLNIASQPSAGTTFTLTLPLSLAIIRALLVECDAVRIGIPITRVVQTLELSPAEVQSSGRQLLFAHQDELLPMLSLRKILNWSRAHRADPIPVVVTEVWGRRIGLVVDRLVAQREVFVQRLPAPFNEIRGCNGATILGDGQIVFLLDLQSLLERRRQP